VRIVFLGPPGSGKGTQAKLLSERLRVPAIASGEMLRAAVREQTPLGARAKTIMEAGQLVPDELMIGLISERIAAADARRGFLLDGFPRTVEQARALDRLLEGNGEGLSAVLNLSVPEAVIVERLRGRKVEERRSDDRPQTVRERLRLYREYAEPLVAFYRTRRLLADVDGVGEIAEIGERIGQALARLTAPSARGVVA
jgi:adenylate kinase